jgi:long-chain acyl-CoA synthetase
MLYHHTLGLAARYYPDRPALNSGGRHVTFRELAARVEQVAAELHQRGFRPGDRLAMLMPNSAEYVELVLACCRIGVISVPLNIRYAQAELDDVLDDAKPRGLVRDRNLPQPSKRLEWEHVQGERELGSDGPCPPAFYDPSAPLVLFYTSGTTGRSKGVPLTHGNLLTHMHHGRYFLPLDRATVWMAATPFFHVSGFPAVLASVGSGAMQVPLPRFDLAEFCELVEREKVTHTFLIPTMINMLTQFPGLAKYDLSSLRLLAYGGSPIAPEIVQRVRRTMPGTKLLQAYGMTEAPIITVLLDEEHTPDHLLSCGRPCPGIELEVVDGKGNPVAPGELGEIVSRGGHTMRGYWQRPEESRRALSEDGWLHTGDVGYQAADGYFYIVDRAKDMVITGGENVYSAEVEAVIYDHPAVKEAAIIGTPDPQWGERVTACIVLKDGTSLTAAELSEYCRNRLANYKIPRRVEFYERELPKGATGKILKRALREPFWKEQARGVG